MRAANAELAHCVAECGASATLLQGRDANLATEYLATARDVSARRDALQRFRHSLRQVRFPDTALSQIC